MDKTILNIIPGDTYYTEPRYGIKLRNLNNPNVYFDYTNRRPSVDNFRTLYFQYANYLMVEKNNDAKATAVLDTMNTYISPTQFPMPYPMVYQMARLYSEADAKAQTEKYARLVVASCERLMNNKDLLEADMYARSYDPYIVATESYELLGEFDKAVATLRRYQGVVGNAPELQVRIDETDIKRYEAKGDYANALKVAEQIVAKYDTAQGEFIKQMLPGLRQKVTQLRTKLGLQTNGGQANGGQPTGAQPAAGAKLQ